MTMQPAFADPGLINWLEAASAEDLDEFKYGVVAMMPDGIVAAYNRAEATVSGLHPERVIGRHFFSSIAPCSNNDVVGGRFEQAAGLDAIVDYVFAFRRAPTAVRLRLLKRSDARYRYLIVGKRLSVGR